MKKFISFIIVIVIILMLVTPQTCISGSKYGVELWLFTVLPTLLPFIILSNILVNMNVCKSVASFIHPITSRLFHTSIYGTYAVIIGFLFGYPMGAKTIADLLEKKYISNEESQYLLSFCNNPSPMYMLGYVSSIAKFKRQTSLIILLIIYISAYITSILYRKREGSNIFCKFDHEIYDKEDDCAKDIWNIFEFSILNGFKTIAKLGGYIIIFSIFVKLITTISFIPITAKAFVASFTEITSGAYYIMQTNMSTNAKTILVISTSMFGGLSILFQTLGVISNSSLKCSLYVKYKILSATITALLTAVYVLLI